MTPSTRAPYQSIGLALGPVLALFLAFMDPPQGMSVQGWHVTALASWMAIWWATEAIPVAATALLPLIILPLTGIASPSEASTPYTNPVIFLLLGGFILAMAMQRWGLHRRIALNILARVGDHPSALIAGFMATAALLSMWISNTATTLMMVPIALSVAEAVAGEKNISNNFTIALLLGIAYAASIGGLGTIVGTPPNAMLVAYLNQEMGVDIGFTEWMAFGVPVVLVMVPAAWFVLTRLTFRMGTADGHAGEQEVQTQLKSLGPISVPERRIALLFGAVAVAWMFRPLIADLPFMGGLTDMGIAVLGAVAAFVIPAGGKGNKGLSLLSWEWAVRLPWGVILLFGGGLSLAAAISSTGLAEWLGNELQFLTHYHILILMLAIVTLIIFLTELTSNTATIAALLPVLGEIAKQGQFDPIIMAAPAALAASCAFMLPVATGPNAVVFSGGHVSVPQMAKAGFRLNIIGIFVLTMICYALVPIIFS